MLPIHEAIRRMMPAFAPLAPERVSLDAALGRHLVAPLTTRQDAPPFDNSAMDGWAVRAEDLTTACRERPVTLPAAGESRAGGGVVRHEPGTATRIFTGAPLPPGADAVVAQEDTERRDGEVAFFVAPSPGRHVRARGSDLRAGAPLLPSGHRLSPGTVALLASQGIGAVTVRRRPRVAILSTGDELRELGEPATPSTIVNSNAPMLAALVREAGAVPRLVPKTADDREAVAAALAGALDDDVLITTGGVSVGDYDVVREAYAQVGIDASFWKVAVKPGKPLTFGRHGSTPVVGLPGNPVSAFVTFFVFVRPGLRRMLGDPTPFPAARHVRLLQPYEHRPGRSELVRARLTPEGAELHPRQGSGAIPSLAWADALVVIPADIPRIEAGETVLALPLRDEASATSPFGGP